jgi:hypothetical protein
MANLNFFRGKYSDYVVLKNNGKVLDTNLYFTLPMQEAILNDEKKSTSYCLFQGTNLLACSANYGDIQTASRTSYAANHTNRFVI